MTRAVQRMRRRADASGGRGQMPRGKLRTPFTHIGRRNFFSYARPIEHIRRKHGFGSPNAVRRQLRRSPVRLERLLHEEQ